MKSDIDDPDLPLEAMFQTWPVTASVFVRHSMLCVGCPIAPFHTVVDACREYCLDESAFRDELRRVVRSGDRLHPRG